MESLNASPNLENFTYINKQSTVSPFSYLHITSSNSDTDLIAHEGSPKSIIKNHQSMNNKNSFHQRCSSASSLLLNIEDDQPSWLDDLLAEPEVTTFVHPKGHRHSLSDFSYIREESYDNKSSSSEEKFSKAINEKHKKEDLDEQSGESSGERSNSRPTQSNTVKAELNRAKQHTAHRSRVRKLKYIADLESTIQLLQVEGSGIHAEIEFLNQQNLILSMENMALRQRLDNVSHGQLIKQYEQEMLERELGRLQTLHHLQNQQQMQVQHQIMQQ